MKHIEWGWLVVNKDVLNLYLKMNHLDSLLMQTQMINITGSMAIMIMVVLVDILSYQKVQLKSSSVENLHGMMTL